MRFFAAAIGISALAVTQCYAADLPNRAAPPVFVPPVVPLTWSGCYVGGFGAYDIARTRNVRSESDTRTTTSTSTTRTAGVPDATTTTTTSTSRQTTSAYGRNLNGGDGGGRIGCNYQTGGLVVGGQLEGGYLGISGTTVDPLRTTSFSRLSGGAYGAGSIRLGYALGERTLLFAKGGVGFADLRYFTGDGALNYASTVRGSQVMPLVGAGLEYKLTPNISVTGEYTYFRPGCRTPGYNYAQTGPSTQTVTAVRGATTTTTSTPVTVGNGSTSTCVDKHMISIGLNYYFNTPATPVVARY